MSNPSLKCPVVTGWSKSADYVHNAGSWWTTTKEGILYIYYYVGRSRVSIICKQTLLTEVDMLVWGGEVLSLVWN